MFAFSPRCLYRKANSRSFQRLRFVGIAGIWLAGLICSTATSNPHELPSLGDGSSSIVSPKMEARIGSVFLKQLNAALPMADDVVIQYYVEQQIAFLAQYS